MGVNAAPHHSRYSMWPRTLGFRGLEHPAPPRKRGRPCPPVTPAPSRTRSELQRAQSVCSREPGGFPQCGEMPGAGLASEAGGGGGNCLPRAWPHPASLEGPLRSQLSPLVPTAPSRSTLRPPPLTGGLSGQALWQDVLEGPGAGLVLPAPQAGLEPLPKEDPLRGATSSRQLGAAELVGAELAQ